MSFIRSLLRAFDQGPIEGATPPRQPLPNVQPPDPPVQPASIVAGEQDPRIAAAIAQAKAQWPEFVQAYHRRTPNDVFVVKAPIRQGNDCEWMWISLASITADELSGTIAHVPALLRGIAKGDPVRVRLADLGDWMYSIEGKLIGGFTEDLLD